MKKMLEGTVVSMKMQKTAVVTITRITPHPLYKKLIKRDKKIKADTGNLEVTVGDRVRFVQTRPLSATKFFKIVEVIKNGSA